MVASPSSAARARHADGPRTGYRVALATTRFAGVLLPLLVSCRHDLQRTEESKASTNAQSTLASAAPNSGPDASTPGFSSENPREVSILELIATPEKFRGQFVRLVAYVVIEFEGTAAYLHAEDNQHAIMRNALWLDISNKPASRFVSPGYAVVEARFDPDRHGHMSLFAGVLTQVSRVDPWPGQQPSNP
jgi:hypothetical protein